MTTVAKTTHNATLIEPAPLEVVSTLAAAGVDVADIRICVCTDLAADGLHYGDQWLVVVEDRVLVVRQQPAGWAVIDTAIADVVHAHTEALVGGGRLLIERHDEPTLSVAFTSTEAAKFSEVARGVEQLRKHQALFINGHLERVRCDRCSRLLPEKDGVCPACIRKWSTMKRITGYISP